MIIKLTFSSPIAFHPASVLFETPSHTDLIGKVGVRSLVSDVISELLQIATVQGCTFPSDFKDKTIQTMLKPTDTNSIMYQDFSARRPMEVETYLGSPIKLAEAAGVKVPRIETLYSLLHNCNILNQSRPPLSTSPNSAAGYPNGPRLSSGPPPRPPMNGPMNGGMNGGPPNGARRPSMGPPMRRGPPPMNGYPPRPPNGYPRGPPPNQLSRRTSFDNNDLEEFSHVVLYDDIPEGDVVPGYPNMPNGNGPSQLTQRERELMLREREVQMREQEYGMRRSGPRRAPPSHRDLTMMTMRMITSIRWLLVDRLFLKSILTTST